MEESTDGLTPKGLTDPGEHDAWLDAREMNRVSFVKAGGNYYYSLRIVARCKVASIKLKAAVVRAFRFVSFAGVECGLKLRYNASSCHVSDW